MIIYMVAARTATSFDSIFPSWVNKNMNLDMICLPDEKKKIRNFTHLLHSYYR